MSARVTINPDAANLLDRIRDLRALPATNSDREELRRREEVRSYAVEFITEIERELATDPSPAAWLQANGIDLAPLTGQDWRALEAIAACWEMYAGADDAGRIAAIMAVRSLLTGMQPKCRELTKNLIARSLDWECVGTLWWQVSS